MRRLPCGEHRATSCQRWHQATCAWHSVTLFLPNLLDPQFFSLLCHFGDVHPLQQKSKVVPSSCSGLAKLWLQRRCCLRDTGGRGGPDVSCEPQIFLCLEELLQQTERFANEDMCIWWHDQQMWWHQQIHVELGCPSFGQCGLLCQWTVGQLTQPDLEGVSSSVCVCWICASIVAVWPLL